MGDATSHWLTHEPRDLRLDVHDNISVSPVGIPPTNTCGAILQILPIRARPRLPHNVFDLQMTALDASDTADRSLSFITTFCEDTTGTIVRLKAY